MRMLHLQSGLFITCMLIALSGWAQSKTISGKVTSPEGDPLPDVSVTIKGKATDAESIFTLTTSEGDVLMFSSVGYISTEFTVGSSSQIDIVLITTDSKLDEVVVVGYGTVKRSKLTSSVSKLDNRVLETGLRSNPAQALSGTIPGLRVATGTGRPGSLPAIVLRGGTNFDGSGSPLFYGCPLSLSVYYSAFLFNLPLIDLSFNITI